ncbi:MAG: Ig-like domain-containing protein [Atopobiaceae bacterium]|nr:Ig-like domain-containing protein [Atopobiaceae bacterium]
MSDAQTSQQRYLVSFLDRVEDAAYGEGFVNANGEHIWDLMDQQSAADMWLVQEFFCNPDAYGTPSTYLYKLRDTTASDGSVVLGKLFWGPLWDFDIAWWRRYIVEGFDNTDYMWINLLRQDPGFVETIKESWKVLDAALQELDREGGLLDQYVREIEESWNADHERWQKHDDDADSTQQAIEALGSHFEARRAWFNAHLDELQTSYHTVRFVVDDTEVMRFDATDNRKFYPDPPEAPEKKGLLFDGWKTIEGTTYDRYEPVREVATYYATYLDPSTLIPATDIFFPLPEIWIQYGTVLHYDLFPLDAQDQRITWSSSDEDVVTVDHNGYLVTQVSKFDESGKAEAVVTARLVNSGNEASVRMVVYDPSIATPPEPTSITVDEAMTIDEGTWRQVHFESEPYPSTLNEWYSVRYQSADEGVATVSEAGVVFGVAPGTVVVKAILEDPMTDEVIAVLEIAVTVSAHVEPEPEPESDPAPEPVPEPTPGPEPTPEPKACARAGPSSSTRARAGARARARTCANSGVRIEAHD